MLRFIDFFIEIFDLEEFVLEIIRLRRIYFRINLSGKIFNLKFIRFRD